MNPKIRRVLVSLGHAALVLAIAYVAFLCLVTWRTMIRLKQVRNCADLQTITAVVLGFHDKTGRYPSSIREAIDASSLSESTKVYFRSERDAWGGQFVYSVGKDGFRIVSYGRDRRPDSGQESREPITSLNTCQDLGTDVYSTEQGIVRCCGK